VSSSSARRHLAARGSGGASVRVPQGARQLQLDMCLAICYNWVERAEMTEMRSHLDLGVQSKVEIGVPGANSRFDPKTAHEGAGDPGFETFIPETCALCEAERISLSEATEAVEGDF